MSSGTQTAATLEDLSRVDGKAELIGGRIVHFMATGRKPSRVASRITRSLDDYAEATGRGKLTAAISGSPSNPSARAANRSRRTPPISSARFRTMRCGSSKGRRRSPSRSGARGITAMRPSLRWPPSGPTISRRVLRSSGTWTPSIISSGSIERMPPTSRSSSSTARRPMPNRPSPAGEATRGGPNLRLIHESNGSARLTDPRRVALSTDLRPWSRVRWVAPTLRRPDSTSGLVNETADSDTKKGTGVIFGGWGPIRVSGCQRNGSRPCCPTCPYSSRAVPRDRPPPKPQSPLRGEFAAFGSHRDAAPRNYPRTTGTRFA